MTPAPESGSEYDSKPFSTPDSGTGSIGLELLESVPWLEPIPLLDLKLLLEVIFLKDVIYLTSHIILRYEFCYEYTELPLN